jgi:hypothetical protein
MAESGIASVYAYAGGKTASGESANPGGLTAAHRTLALCALSIGATGAVLLYGLMTVVHSCGAV